MLDYLHNNNEHYSNGTDGLAAVLSPASQEIWNILPQVVQAYWNATEETVYLVPIVQNGAPEEIHLILPNCTGAQTEAKTTQRNLFFAFLQGFFGKYEQDKK